MYELELKHGDAITFYYLETSSKKRHGFFIGYTEKLKNVKDADCVIVYDTETKTFVQYCFYKFALYSIEKENKQCPYIEKLVVDYTKKVMIGDMPAVQSTVHFLFLELLSEKIPVLVQDGKYYAPDITLSSIDDFSDYDKFGVYGLSEFKAIDSIDTYVRDVYLKCFEQLKEKEPRIVIVRDNEILKQAEESTDKNFFTDGSCFQIVKSMIDTAQKQGIGAYLRQQDFVPKFSQVEMDSIMGRV